MAHCAVVLGTGALPANVLRSRGGIGGLDGEREHDKEDCPDKYEPGVHHSDIFTNITINIS